MSGSDLFYVSIFLIVWIVIFLVCREIVCWYFKINVRVELLREIRGLLKGGDPSELDKFGELANDADAGGLQNCYYCKKQFSIDKVKFVNDLPICFSCGKDNRLF